MCQTCYSFRCVCSDDNAASNRKGQQTAEKVLGEGMEEKRENRGARTCDKLGEGIEGFGPLRISQLLPVGFFYFFTSI